MDKAGRSVADAASPPEGELTNEIAPTTAVLGPAVPPASGHRRFERKRTEPVEVAANERIGRFEIIRELARGGMGQVFLARDTKLGRKVANIVTIYEVGEHRGLPFMVLEYLEGTTLAKLLETRLSVEQFTELMIPVVRALERAHEHGIVHRDLKPNNIFVTDRGVVKVLDFGIARILESSDEPVRVRASSVVATSEYTPSDSIVGTLPFMSPEHWSVDTVDHRSDFWALGILYWRALTGGHPAGTRDSDELRARVCDLETPFPSIATRDSTIPPEVVAIVDRCLEKHTARRYQHARELLADLQRVVAPPQPVEDACPYRGLSPFDEEDAKYFFGRSAEIRTARAKLESWPVLAVVGSSGAGKSSFVHAGLIPALRGHDAVWDVHSLRPGPSPLRRLAAITGGPDHGELVEQLREAPGVFGERVRAAAARARRRVLIVVDRLEELFTVCEEEAERRDFLAALLGAADDPSTPVRIIVSMRTEFLDALARHDACFADASRGLFFLSPPDRENLREALVRPAAIAGYAFDEGLADAMLEVVTSRGALPLLSFAAAGLWEARDRVSRKLTLAAYASMGGVGGVFARHADQTVAAIPARQQPLLRAIMTRLVTPAGTRAVVDRRELLSLGPERREVERILDLLVEARVLASQADPDRVDDRDRVASVELAHDMLITEWPTLARWLDAKQGVRAFIHELGQATRRWVARGRPRDLDGVWRGAAQEAVEVAQRHALELSADERDYLREVRRQWTRTRWRWITVLAVALGLAVAGAVFAMARISRAEQAAAETARELEETKREHARRLDAAMRELESLRGKER